MKKKFAAMFMAAAMVFTMAACGQKADTPDTPSTDGAEAQTFVLGTCGPLTGGSEDDRTWPAGLRRCRHPDCEAPPQTP